MGRQAQTEPPIGVDFLVASFELRQDGTMVRSASARGDLAHEPAIYDNGDGVSRVRFTFKGKRRTMNAARVASILHEGVHPKGQVETIAAPNDFRLSNLRCVPRLRHKPNAEASRQSALVARRDADLRLLTALASREHPSVAELARDVGLSKGPVSKRLSGLEARELAEGPRCCPARSWLITAKGRELVAAGRAPLDHLDMAILATLAATPMVGARLASRCAVSEPTAQRRARLLVQRGLVVSDPRRFFSITQAGREALGDIVPRREPWLRPEAVSAALSRDVVERRPVDDRTREQRSQHASLASRKCEDRQDRRRRHRGRIRGAPSDRIAQPFLRSPRSVPKAQLPWVAARARAQPTAHRRDENCRDV